ncbi:MAG: hypothetical protein IPN34_03310 [Planctomycetes bacterium]|nr:hypothetical protein [Planctomycetota bacterium]
MPAPSAAPAQPLELVLADWAGEPRRSHWKAADGLPTAVLEKKELELAIELRGGGASTVLAALAFPADRAGAEVEPSWVGLVEVSRGKGWSLRVPSTDGSWTKVGGPRPLRVEIGAFAPEAYGSLEALFEPTLSAVDRRARWRALASAAQQRREAEIFVVTQKPKIELVGELLEGARLVAGPAGLEPVLPLRIRTPFLDRLEVEGSAVPSTAWGAFPEPGAGQDANERFVLVPWPRRGESFAPSVAVRAIDRLGREDAVEIGQQLAEVGSRVPYLRDDVRPGPSGRLEGWVRDGDPSRWLFEGQDEEGTPRLQHRLVASGARALLSLRMEPGEARIAELVHANGVIPLLGAASTRRQLIGVPREGGLVHFEIPLADPDKDELRCRATTWCELRFWPRAALPDAVVPQTSGPRAALAASAKVETYRVLIYRDDSLPVLDAALGDGAKLAFPAQGEPLLELGALCRFPRQLVVAGRELETPFEDSESVDSGCSYVGKQRLSNQGRLVRGFALPWPRGADGALLTQIPVSIEDRLGRRIERSFRFVVDPALPPLPKLEPLRRRELAGAPKPARLAIETACVGELAVPRFEWEVLRAIDAEADAILRRRVSVFPTESVRVRVDAPAGDYRVEMLVLSGASERLDGYSDGVFAARGGEVVQVALDLRSLGAREASFGRSLVRFALYRAEDRPDCKLAKGEALQELSARILDLAQIELMRDNASPAIMFDTPPDSHVNPLPDPAQRRPPAVLGVALLERFPVDLRLDGRALELPNPLEIDERDPAGEIFAREDRSFAWDWPSGEDGERILTLGVRDRTQRWREASLRVVYDRVPPALGAVERTKAADGALELALEASEELREATWSEGSGAGAVVRFAIDGRKARARLEAANAPRRGVLRLSDRAGNAFELDFSPDAD